MPTPACANCGYSLDGLAPRADGWIICPECSLPQSPTGGIGRTRTRPFTGPYSLSIFLSLAVHAMSWSLMLIYGNERQIPLGPVIPFFLITTPLTTTVLGSWLGCWRARRAWTGTKGRGWRIAGLIVVTATFNVVLFAPLFLWLAVLAVPSF